MPYSSLLPYYHPSTVVMVDDNDRFLKNFSLVLPDNLPVRYFNSAHEALSFIEKVQGGSLDERCFSLLEKYPGESSTFRMETALIEQEISNLNRFQDVSVVIVDYDMPEMNGLELCSRITNPRIRKILLTGVGDEKIAIKAFNAGLINHFLTKSDRDISDKIADIISDLQLQYFHNISMPIQKTLSLKSPDFLRDESFKKSFTSLLKKKNIVEYYFVENPDGFLMVSHDGLLYRLIVIDDHAMESQLFTAKRMSAPANIISGFSQKRLIGWLWSSPEDVDEHEAFDWDEVTFQATSISGDKTWHYALVENPPADIEYDSREASYASYLATLEDVTPRS